MDSLEQRSSDRERRITENAGLVRMVALRLGYGRSDLEDLIQWGQLGLIQAADRYDPSFGTRFSTFAVPYIAGEIRRFLREDRPLKCSRGLHRLCRQIRQFQQEFEAEHTRAPSVLEVCNALRISRENVLLALCAASPVASLDESISSEDEGLSLADTIAAPSPDPLPEDRLTLADCLNSLCEQDRELITLRYYQNKTQTETAQRLGLSQVQVCRMEKRILMRLRNKILQ